MFDIWQCARHSASACDWLYMLLHSLSNLTLWGVFKRCCLVLVYKYDNWGLEGLRNLLTIKWLNMVDGSSNSGLPGSGALPVKCSASCHHWAERTRWSTRSCFSFSKLRCWEKKEVLHQERWVGGCKFLVPRFGEEPVVKKKMVTSNAV